MAQRALLASLRSDTELWGEAIDMLEHRAALCRDLGWRNRLMGFRTKSSKGKFTVLHLGWNNRLGHLLARKQLCRKEPRSPNGQVERESAVCICSTGDQKHSGMYYQECGQKETLPSLYLQL